MEMPQVSEVDVAIERLAGRLRIVPTETISIADAAGRILAENLLADRDSPALDVSAMDGFALHLDSIGSAPLPISATTVAGAPPTTLQKGEAVKIFTGAPVPAGADCVVRREDTTEADGTVRVSVPREALVLGQNIRRQGENIRRGLPVLEAGTELNSAAIATVASFGPAALRVHRKTRVVVLNTGDELAAAGSTVEPWMIRDSNGPTLETWLRTLPWIEIVARERVADQLAAVCQAVAEHSADSDAVILTGGVSMGDTDYVPAAVESLGGQVVFHRLPIRPGKPIFGASLDGKLVLGLPGNPVSVAVTARVFAWPLLGKLAGRGNACVQPLVELSEPDDRALPLTWYRLVSVSAEGRVRLIRSNGSGDLVSLGQSQGFITVPAGRSGHGPWQFTAW